MGGAISILMTALMAKQVADIVFQLYPPLMNSIHKKAWSSWDNLNPTLENLIQLLYRKEITQDQFLTKCSETGYNAQIADKLFNSGKSLLGAADYVSIYRRGFIDKATLNTSLQKLRFDAVGVDNLLQATEYFPSPQDLITFAVREVYTPDIVRQFGMDQDLPPKFVTEAEKVGVTVEQAENFWKAHWRLPSANQGFEMLHRGVITEPQLRMLLKAVDYMPFWRDGLTKISYRVPTRVDVRRMYRIGVYTKDQVLKNYKDLGYTSSDADDLTAFTVLNENSEKTSITKSSVIKSYKKDIITREELQNYLTGLKYTTESINFIFAELDYDAVMEEFEDLETELKLRYKQGILDIQEVENILTENNFPASYAQKILSSIIRKVAEKTRMPTKADLENWLLKGVIEEDYYSSTMSSLGYTQDVIVNYLTEISFDQSTEDIKYLNVKIYIRWLTKKIITQDKFVAITTAMRYSEDDINNMILETQMVV